MVGSHEDGRKLNKFYNLNSFSFKGTLMKHSYLLLVFIVSLLAVAFFMQQILVTEDKPVGEPLELFVGVDVAYGDVTEIKMLVDRISGYTNMIVVGCTGIAYDSAKLVDVCQYVYDRGFSFIIYSDMPPDGEWFLSLDILEGWGDKFLGMYAFDEGGGWQLDSVSPRPFRVDEADNRTDAANKFVEAASERLDWFSGNYTDSVSFPLFTSDYALYWFDYKAGYDVVFAEFAWDYSRELNLALCRGAAAVQGRDWGVMITWTYDVPPYIESGEELYGDMVLAYESGAKYILVFDSNRDYSHGILQEEHFDALERFWQYSQDHPRYGAVQSSRVAYVLPTGCGYGFRGPEDRIWGLWESNEFTDGICVELGDALLEYGSRLDIVYDDGLNSVNTVLYSELVYWNGTVCSL